MIRRRGARQDPESAANGQKVESSTIAGSNLQVSGDVHGPIIVVNPAGSARQEGEADSASRIDELVVEGLRSSAAQARKTIRPETIPNIDRLGELTRTLAASPGALPTPLFVVGEGGYGKSVLLGQLFDSFSARGGTTLLVPCARVPVNAELADLFSLDRALGDAALNARMSRPLTEVIAALAEAGPVRLLLDTLDLVVREENADDLLYLLRDLSGRCALFVTCREQEWRDYLEDDPEVAASVYRMPSLGAHDIVVWAEAYLKTAELDPSTKAGFLTSLAPGGANRGVLEICTSPLRLAMTCEVYAKSGSVPEDLTVTQLYEQYWDKRIARDRRKRRSTEARAQEATAEAIAAEVWRSSQTRFVEFVAADMVNEDAVTLSRLLSDGVVTNIGGRVGFFHQTYSEFGVARLLARAGTERDLARLADGLRSTSPVYWPIAKHLLMITTSADRYELLAACVPVDVVEGLRAQILGAFNRGSAPLVTAITDRVWEGSPALLLSCIDVMESSPPDCLAAALDVIIRCVAVADGATASRVGTTAAKLIMRIGPADRPAALRRVVGALVDRSADIGRGVASSVLSRLVQQSAAVTLDPDLARVLVDNYAQLPEAAQADVLGLAAALPPTAELDLALVLKALRFDCPDGAVDDGTALLLRVWADPASRRAAGWENWTILFEMDLPTRWIACQVRLASAMCADDGVARELLATALGPGNTARDRYTNTAKYVADRDPALVASVIRGLDRELTAGAVGTLCSITNHVSPRLSASDRQAAAAVLGRCIHIDARRVWPTMVKLCADDVDLLRTKATELEQWAARFDASDTQARTVVRSTFATFLNVVDAQAVTDLAPALRVLCEGDDIPDRIGRARLEGMITPFSVTARDWTEQELLRGRAPTVASAAANAVVAGFNDWSDDELAAVGVPWALGLLGSPYAGTARILAKGLTTLSERVALPVSATNTVVARLERSMADADDAQVLGALVELLVKMEHSGGIPKKLALTVVDLFGRVVRAPRNARDGNQLPALFALYIRAITALGMRHCDEDEVWKIVSDILTTIDTGAIAGRARRPLATLLFAATTRYPVFIARVEGLWPVTTNANKRAIAECFVRLEAGSLAPRSLGLARRPDCPPDVANYIHSKLGG